MAGPFDRPFRYSQLLPTPYIAVRITSDSKPRCSIKQRLSIMLVIGETSSLVLLAKGL